MSSLMKKNPRITNQISIFCISLGTGIQLFFAYPKNNLKIWLVILFLPRQFMLSKLLCLAALWNWAQVILVDDNSQLYFLTLQSMYNILLILPSKYFFCIPILRKRIADTWINKCAPSYRVRKRSCTYTKWENLFIHVAQYAPVQHLRPPFKELVLFLYKKIYFKKSLFYKPNYHNHCTLPTLSLNCARYYERPMPSFLRMVEHAFIQMATAAATTTTATVQQAYHTSYYSTHNKPESCYFCRCRSFTSVTTCGFRTTQAGTCIVL